MENCIQIFNNNIFRYSYDKNIVRHNRPFETFLIKSSSIYFIRDNNNDYYSGNTIRSGFNPYKIQILNNKYRLSKEYDKFKMKEDIKIEKILLSSFLANNLAIDSYLKNGIIDINLYIKNIFKKIILIDMANIYFDINVSTHFY